jgi:hypothetical protein
MFHFNISNKIEKSWSLFISTQKEFNKTQNPFLIKEKKEKTKNTTYPPVQK